MTEERDRPDWAWPEGIWPATGWLEDWDVPPEEWDGEEWDTEESGVEVSLAGPGDRLSVDLLRWTRDGEGSIPGGEQVLRELYGDLASGPESTTLGAYLCSEESGTYRVACGSTPTHHWVADRYQLALRPRKEPWTVLRDRAAEVQRVSCTEIIDWAVWWHWRSGTRVREVALGTDSPVARGTVQDFERPLWTGRLPKPAKEPVLVEVPEEERVDIDALIATEPPEHLGVDEEGARRLLLTPPRSWEILEHLRDGRGAGAGFMSVGEWTDEDPERFISFLNLDTLNHVPTWGAEEDEEYPDVAELARTAMAQWFGLTGSPCSWDWPCQVWTVRG